MMVILLIYLFNILCSDDTEIRSGTSEKDRAMARMEGVVKRNVKVIVMECVNKRIAKEIERTEEKSTDEDGNSFMVNEDYGRGVISSRLMNFMLDQVTIIMIAKMCVIAEDIKNNTEESGESDDIGLRETVDSIMEEITESILVSLAKINISEKLKNFLAEQGATVILEYFSPPDEELPEVDLKTPRANDLLNLFKEFNDSEMKDTEELTVEEKKKGFGEIFNKVFGGICTTFHLELINFTELMCFAELMSTTEEILLDKLYKEFKKGSTLFYGSEGGEKRREEFIEDPESFITCNGYFTRDLNTFLNFNGNEEITESKFINSNRVYDVLILLCRFKVKDPTAPPTPSRDSIPIITGCGIQ